MHARPSTAARAVPPCEHHLSSDNSKYLYNVSFIQSSDVLLVFDPLRHSCREQSQQKRGFALSSLQECVQRLRGPRLAPAGLVFVLQQHLGPQKGLKKKKQNKE